MSNKINAGNERECYPLVNMVNFLFDHLRLESLYFYTIIDRLLNSNLTNLLLNQCRHSQ